MLVLTRRVGESVTIDGGVEVRVIKSTGSRVKLAIIAPPNVGIRRTEAPEWEPSNAADAACDVETEEIELVEIATVEEESAELVGSPAA